MDAHGQTAQAMPSRWLTLAWRSGWLLLVIILSGCNWLPAADLSLLYEPPQYVVTDSWNGSNPFVDAMPVDGELRPDWWKLYDDPVLNRLIEQAVAANPDLQAAVERSVP